MSPVSSGRLRDCHQRVVLGLKFSVCQQKEKEEEGEDHFVLLPVRSLQEDGWLVVSYTDKCAMKLLTKQFYSTMTVTGEHIAQQWSWRCRSEHP